MRAVRHEGEVAKVKVGQQHTYNCSSKVALKRLSFIRSCHNYMFRSFSCPPRRLLIVNDSLPSTTAAAGPNRAVDGSSFLWPTPNLWVRSPQVPKLVLFRPAAQLVLAICSACFPQTVVGAQ